MEYIQVTVGQNAPIEVPKGTTLAELSKQYEPSLKNPILVAKMDNSLKELHHVLTKDCCVSFLDITDENGFRVYQRSVTFLMVCAIKQLFGDTARVVLEHSLNKNYYCRTPDIDLTDDVLAQIEERMKEIVQRGERIQKLSVSLDEGIELAKKFDIGEKINILRYRRTSNISFYRLCDIYNYFYGAMAYTTSVLKVFKLVKYNEGFFLQFASRRDSNELKNITYSEKISQVFMESSQWAKILNVDTVGALNDMVCHGRIKDIVLISEALHEKKIANIADRIVHSQKSIVLIAGPSSSGKTTFAERLCIQLRVNGIRPYIVSIDNYYRNREDTPVGDDGQRDYERLEALDLKQFNTDINNLLKGETVQIPSFNFVTGKRVYKGDFIKLHKDEVLVIEGIHGLNEKLTALVPRESKFKIFISALTQLNLDSHNRIATTDTRIIRRIVRDNQFRSFDAKMTIAMWHKVMEGERNYIFPFQNEADIMFNSALVYELSVLKQYVEPLLFNITNEAPEYTEARRLIKFLDSFLAVGSEEIPTNSIIREFIGKSCFQT